MGNSEEKVETNYVQTDLEDYIMPEPAKRQPFDFKIKELKRYLKLGGMNQHEINKTVKLYKQKVYDKVAEVKDKMEKELETKLNASNQ